MPGIGVIHNPRSKKNKSNPERMGYLGYILGDRGESVATQSVEQIDDVMVEFKEREIDILAINGGDGSNHVTMSSMVRIYGDQPMPKICLLRGGTLNTIATGVGVFGRPEYIMYNLQHKYARREKFETTFRDLMCFNKDRYGFIFGSGVIGKFMETYYGTGTPSVWQGVKTLGIGVASAATGGKLAKYWFRLEPMRIVADDFELPWNEFACIGAGSVHQIGVGFTPWFRCEDEPHSFHVFVMHHKPYRYVPELLPLYIGRPQHPEKTYETIARKLLIEAENPFSYTIDGEMLRCEDGRMAIEVGPRVEIILR